MVTSSSEGEPVRGSEPPPSTTTEVDVVGATVSSGVSPPALTSGAGVDGGATSVEDDVDGGTVDDVDDEDGGGVDDVDEVEEVDAGGSVDDVEVEEVVDDDVEDVDDVEVEEVVDEDVEDVVDEDVEDEDVDEDGLGPQNWMLEMSGVCSDPTTGSPTRVNVPLVAGGSYHVTSASGPPFTTTAEMSTVEDHSPTSAVPSTVTTPDVPDSKV